MVAGMGTELHYSPTFFTTLTRNHGNTVTISFDTTPDARAPSRDRSLKVETRTSSASDPPQQPMERLQCHKESLRKTMLEHEKVFKEQVRELHRLYRTQKLLMSQLQTREQKLHRVYSCAAPGATAQPSSSFWNSASSGLQGSSSHSTGNKRRHSALLNGDHSAPSGHGAKASLGSQELTICSGEKLGAQSDGFQHQPAPEEGMPTGAGDDAQAPDQKLSTETPASYSDEECDLELTLAIGCGGGKKRAGGPSHSDTPSGCCPGRSSNSTRHRTPSTPARSDPGERAEPSVGVDRERLQRPTWLFQGLSLNRT